MTKIDGGAIVSSLITEIALPEIVRAIRAHHQATGEILTEEQLRARLEADADGVIARGEAFLRARGALLAAAPVDALGPVYTGNLGD